jgi:hypothetical protein
MRRILPILAVTAGLALAAFAPAAAAQTATVPRPDIPVYDYEIQSNLTNDFDLGHGVGKLVTLNELDPTVFNEVGRTGKWLEFQDVGSGDCLDLVGSVKAGFHVNEERCNDRSAELWWLVSGNVNETQIHNQYGTKLLHHDACMWTESNSDKLMVRACKSHQPNQQLWDILKVLAP